MGQYVCGDVLLASVALDNRSIAKTRPVVVIGTSADGTVQVCPVSSKPPSDAPGLPLSIDDFAQGGLDLFGESYILTSRVLSVRSGEVIGKKGRLLRESLAEILFRIPDNGTRGTRPDPNRKTGRPPR